MARFLLALLAACSSLPIHAGIVTYELSGAAQGALLDAFGKPFSAVLSWDTDTPDGCLSPEFGCYSGAGVTGFSLHYAGFDLITSPILGPSTLGPALDVYRPTGPQPHQFRFSALLPAQLGFDSIEATIQLFDDTRTVFADDSLPSSLHLSDFSQAQLSLSAFPEGEVGNLAATSDITGVAAVPVPPTVLLMVLGLLISGLARSQDSGPGYPPSRGLLHGVKENRGMTYNCERAGEDTIECNFVVTTIRRGVPDDEIQEKIAVLADTLLDEAETKGACGSTLAELQSFTDPSAVLPDGRSVAGWKAENPELFAEIESTVSHLTEFCDDPSESSARDFAAFSVESDAATCRISSQTYSSVFKQLESNEGIWIVESGPSGACGVLRTDRFVWEPALTGGFGFYNYISSKRVLNKDGSVKAVTGEIPCSSFDEEEYPYSWESRQVFLRCKSFEFKVL
jgi:hypothetical protein